MRKKSIRSIEERDTLVKQWSGLPRYCVNRFRGFLKKNNIDIEDAEQECCLALIRCAELWDESRQPPVMFKSYAIKAMDQMLLKFGEQPGVISLPRRYCKKYAHERVAARHVSQLTNDSVWLQAVEHDNELETEEAKQDIAVAVATLPPRHRRVIEMRFWKQQSLNQIGRIIGICPEQVRTIQNQALKRLRAKLNGHR